MTLSRREPLTLVAPSASCCESDHEQIHERHGPDENALLLLSAHPSGVLHCFSFSIELTEASFCRVVAGGRDRAGSAIIQDRRSTRVHVRERTGRASSYTYVVHLEIRPNLDVAS